MYNQVQMFHPYPKRTHIEKLLLRITYQKSLDFSRKGKENKQNWPGVG